MHGHAVEDDVTLKRMGEEGVHRVAESTLLQSGSSSSHSALNVFVIDDSHLLECGVAAESVIPLQIVRECLPTLTLVLHLPCIFSVV